MLVGQKIHRNFVKLNMEISLFWAKEYGKNANKRRQQLEKKASPVSSEDLKNLIYGKWIFLQTVFDMIQCSLISPKRKGLKISSKSFHC